MQAGADGSDTPSGIVAYGQFPVLYVYLLFADEIGYGLFYNIVGNAGKRNVGYRMHCLVGQRGHYPGLGGVNLPFAARVHAMCAANVALSAVIRAHLAEIPQQLSAAAYVVVLGIAYHGINAFGVLALAVVVYIVGEHQAFGFLPPLQIADVRYLLSWYVAYDVPPCQVFQYHVNAVARQSCLLLDEAFLDIAEVGEQTAVIPQ